MSSALSYISGLALHIRINKESFYIGAGLGSCQYSECPRELCTVANISRVSFTRIRSRTNAPSGVRGMSVGLHCDQSQRTGITPFELIITRPSESIHT